MVGLIKRNFINLSISSFVFVYKKLVRSQLDYCNSVWTPYRKSAIETLEKVQKKATKILSKIIHLKYSDLLKICKLPTLHYWQVRGDMTTAVFIMFVSGYYTRQLIPEVGTKGCFPEKRNIGIPYCHFLLHDTMLRDDSFRTGTSDTPVCACGLERETAVHFLLYCNRFQENRNLLQDTVTEISDLSAWKKRLRLSEALLLAPMSDDVTSKEEKFIKEALFGFIAELSLLMN